MNRCVRGKGFTLIELLIVLAIITIILVIAVPSFTSFISSNRVTSATNDFLQGITVTRIEALKRGRRVLMMPNDAAGAPSIAGQWRYGWTVFIDNNDNGIVEASDNNLLLDASEIAAGNLILKHTPLETSTVIADPAGSAFQPFTDTGSKTYISFDGTGYPRTLPPASGTLTGGIWINDTIAAGATNRRTVCLAILGPPRVLKGNVACS
jgi:prepilin-type N-terminal cleavage/methylation domain-containing protein